MGKLINLFLVYIKKSFFALCPTGDAVSRVVKACYYTVTDVHALDLLPPNRNTTNLKKTIFFITYICCCHAVSRMSISRTITSFGIDICVSRTHCFAFPQNNQINSVS